VKKKKAKPSQSSTWDLRKEFTEDDISPVKPPVKQKRGDKIINFDRIIKEKQKLNSFTKPNMANQNPNKEISSDSFQPSVDSIQDPAW